MYYIKLIHCSSNSLLIFGFRNSARVSLIMREREKFNCLKCPNQLIGITLVLGRLSSKTQSLIFEKINSR